MGPSSFDPFQNYINNQRRQQQASQAQNAFTSGGFLTFSGYNFPSASFTDLHGDTIEEGMTVRIVSGMLVRNDFHGEAIFRGDSLSQPDCVALEVLDPVFGKIRTGTAQNGWWNFRKEDTHLLEIVSSDKKQPVEKEIKKEPDFKPLEKLVIDDKSKKEIIAVLKQHTHSDKIFKEWGLDETIKYGKGMAFLFYGEPGTGKTWGANLIAECLHTTLMVLTAAEIQSSEPGAAQRNLQQAFATATKENKVLLLDECDSLIFDRKGLGMILASEVNTLLTEIENFKGTVILATNRIAQLDPALERRISLILNFPFPTKEQRVEIWKKMIPEKLPVCKEFNVESLAGSSLTGGLIKNAVLHAARIAASEESSEVRMEHFTSAIERVTKSKNLMGKGHVQTDGMSQGVGIDKNKIADIFK